MPIITILRGRPEWWKLSCRGRLELSSLTGFFLAVNLRMTICHKISVSSVFTIRDKDMNECCYEQQRLQALARVAT